MPHEVLPVLESQVRRVVCLHVLDEVIGHVVVGLRDESFHVLKQMTLRLLVSQKADKILLCLDLDLQLSGGSRVEHLHELRVDLDRIRYRRYVHDDSLVIEIAVEVHLGSADFLVAFAVEFGLHFHEEDQLELRLRSLLRVLLLMQIG